MRDSRYTSIARDLAVGPQADFLQSVFDAFIMKWSTESCLKETEFETLVATIERESKIKAFRILKDEINRIAQSE